MRRTKLDPTCIYFDDVISSSNLYEDLLSFCSNLCLYRLTVVATYVYIGLLLLVTTYYVHIIIFCLMSTYMYEYFICTTLYHICVATHVYNRFCFMATFI